MSPQQKQATIISLPSFSEIALKSLSYSMGITTENCWAGAYINVDFLSLLWWRPLSYRNQSIDLLCRSMDWFLCDTDFRHERVKLNLTITEPIEPLSLFYIPTAEVFLASNVFFNYLKPTFLQVPWLSW